MVRYDYESFRRALGKRIKELRKERNITNRDFVTKHGFHLTQLARIERGEALSVPTLLRLAEAFQLPLEHLVAGLIDAGSIPTLKSDTKKGS